MVEGADRLSVSWLCRCGERRDERAALDGGVPYLTPLALEVHARRVAGQRLAVALRCSCGQRMTATRVGYEVLRVDATAPPLVVEVTRGLLGYHARLPAELDAALLQREALLRRCLLVAERAPQASRPAIEAALRALPGDPSLVRLAALLVERGQPELALTVADARLIVEPEDLDAALWAGLAALAVAQVGREPLRHRAELHLAAAAQAPERLLALPAEAGGDAPEWLAARVRALVAVGRLDEAQAETNRLLAQTERPTATGRELILLVARARVAANEEGSPTMIHRAPPGRVSARPTT
jgi:hypothetical protein